MSSSSIDSLNQNKTTIGKTLRYIEWALILAVTLITILTRFFYGTTFTAADEYYLLYACLAAFTILSFFFPIDRPLWQRRAYIFLEILCLLPSIFKGLGLNIFIFLFLAKSCFLLSRKDVIFTAIAAGVANEIARTWGMPGIIARELANIDNYATALSNKPQIIIASIISNTVLYLAISTFIILLCFVILAEQKSRQKAIALAKEVETLAGALERTRIAREIHDSLGHTLTGLNIQLELAQSLHGENAEKTKIALDTAKNLASQSLTEVRRSVATMRDYNFDLNSALITLVEQCQQDPCFKIKYQVNLPQLSLQTSHQVYCIVQESLTNIQKHSRASSASIRTRKENNETILEIADNGIGFDERVVSCGFGLRGMRERVQIFGGKIKIDSGSGKGTLIQIAIPLNYY